MKKLRNTYIYILLACITTSLFPACSDFLNSDTPSIITDEFYNTKAGQEKLLVSLYYRCRSIFNTGEVQYFGTDLYMAITASEKEKMFNGYDDTFNSTAPVVKNYWANLYKLVQEANILISRCTEETAGNEYASINAQGRFLRVVGYYYLVETFGPVPFYIEENTGVITSTTRTAEKTIYTFMIDELEDIKGVLNMTGNEPGRVTNAAVLHFLGKLYLTRGYRDYAEAADFTKAAQTLDELISDGTYSLLDNYADVYNENNQNNDEVIWAIQYGNNLDYIKYDIDDSDDKGSGNPQQKLFGFNIPALEPDLFVYKQEDYSSMSREYWIIPRVHEFFQNPDIDTRYDATFQRHFYVNNTASEYYGQLGIYFPVWNDNSGITDGAINYYPYSDGWYPQSTALSILNNGIDRMPIIRKFKDTKIEWGAGGSREDVILRLSDAYLLAAEAWLGANNTTAALERVNTLRKRAANSDANYETHMKLTSIDINTIMDERARELLGEHDRWFDLKRSGTLISRAYEYNPFVAEYDNLNKNHLVRPIPQDEINKVSGLTQNEGYY